MMLPGKVLEDLHKAFQENKSKPCGIKYHPHHGDWIEVKMTKDYLFKQKFEMIDEICKEHHLDYHVNVKGILFKKIVLCIYDITL